MHSHTRGRKAALTVLVALALTGAAACSSNDDDDESTSSGGDTDTTAAPAEDVLGEPNPATGEPITIGYVTDGANASFGSDEGRIATFEATVEYVNEYLGGVNGHPLETEHCSTENTPTGATQCAVELTQAGVDAMVVPVTSNDGAVYEGLTGSGIPYFTYTSATGPILTGENAYVMSNPVSAIAAPGLIAQEEGLSTVGFVLIDVPAAVGPITTLATPIYEGLDLDLQITAIAPSVADQTPQLQEAISSGAELFTISGTDDFTIAAFNGLRQLGFEGPILLTDPPDEVLEALSSLDGLIGGGVQTTDPADPDVAVYNAVMAGAGIDEADADPLAFANVVGFVRALTGATDAVDAATISAALAAMPEAALLPLGAGITFQCGTAPVAYVPNICSVDVLQWSYDADGEKQDVAILVIPDGTLDLG